jgi:hypothetical protein
MGYQGEILNDIINPYALVLIEITDGDDCFSPSTVGPKILAFSFWHSID